MVLLQTPQLGRNREEQNHVLNVLSQLHGSGQDVHWHPLEYLLNVLHVALALEYRGELLFCLFQVVHGCLEDEVGVFVVLRQSLQDILESESQEGDDLLSPSVGKFFVGLYDLDNVLEVGEVDDLVLGRLDEVVLDVLQLVDNHSLQGLPLHLGTHELDLGQAEECLDDVHDGARVFEGQLGKDVLHQAQRDIHLQLPLMDYLEIHQHESVHEGVGSVDPIHLHEVPEQLLHLCLAAHRLTNLLSYDVPELRSILLHLQPLVGDQALVEFQPEVIHPFLHYPVLPAILQLLLGLFLEDPLDLFVLDAPHCVDEFLDEPVIVVSELGYPP